MEKRDNPGGKNRRPLRGQEGRWATERMLALVRECRTKMTR